MCGFSCTCLIDLRAFQIGQRQSFILIYQLMLLPGAPWMPSELCIASS